MAREWVDGRAIRRRVRAIAGGGADLRATRSRRTPTTATPAAYCERPRARLAGHSSRQMPQPLIRADDSSRIRRPGTRLRAYGWRPRQTPCDQPSDAGVCETSTAAVAAPSRHAVSRHATGRCFRSPGGRARTGRRPLICARPPSLVRLSSCSPSSRRACATLVWAPASLWRPPWLATSPQPSAAWQP